LGYPIDKFEPTLKIFQAFTYLDKMGFNFTQKGSAYANWSTAHDLEHLAKRHARLQTTTDDGDFSSFRFRLSDLMLDIDPVLISNFEIPKYWHIEISGSCKKLKSLHYKHFSMRKFMDKSTATREAAARLDQTAFSHFQTYCSGNCHTNGAVGSGSIDSIRANGLVFDKMTSHDHAMPPIGEPQPTAAEMRQMLEMLR